jgi:hypothetical protein
MFQIQNFLFSVSSEAEQALLLVLDILFVSVILSAAAISVLVQRELLVGSCRKKYCAFFSSKMVHL